MNVPQEKIICGDCLEVMKDWPDNCVDLVLTDPPYGQTQNPWDSQLDLFGFWEIISRIARGVVVIFSQGMFTADLMKSKEKWWRYNFVWEKDRPTGFLNASRMPLRNHEDILVFYQKLSTYNPQFIIGEPNHDRGKVIKAKNNCYGNFDCTVPAEIYSKNKYPKSVLRYSRPHPPIHPTQKPVELGAYLIATYSNEGDCVLDTHTGSGTFCVAAKKLGRRYIGIDISEKYCEIARMRLEAVDTGVSVAEQKQGQKGLWE